MMSGWLDAHHENLLRELAPQVLGAVMRRFHDFAGAEDAVQEALIAAAIQWPSEGMPDHPRGWLIQVACRRMSDHVRSESARRRRELAVANESKQVAPEVEIWDDTQQDDTLTLLFMCCHPALTQSSAIALTLRAVAGLTNAEIAHAFLVPETTMAQRISRAKKTIKASDVPFRLPTRQERAERLPAVLHVLYLIFNEGYTSSIGPHLQRAELAREAIRLTRSVHTLLPDDTEVAGLLGLMLLTDARRAARTGPEGDLIPLTMQDRSLWDQREIAEGVALLTATLAKGSIGPYQIQAAISAVHDEAPRYEDTDWPQILGLYELLERFSDNPVVTLNRAVAEAMVHGGSAGLKLLDALDVDGRLKGNYRLDAVRAHLLEMAGSHEAAIAHYRTAASGTTSLPERNYLFTQAARLAESTVAVLAAAVTQEKAHREKLSRELEIAREVQQRLFPQELPAIPGIECYGTCRPAHVVGGDYYDFLSLSGAERLDIAIGDVAGKGISAALTMASLQGSLRAEALHGGDDVGAIIAKVNSLLCDATAVNRYATLFYGQFDATTNTLTYVNA
ncbi:MAG: sigma-70 family RNA polymerase sigma factor, partial [Bryobacteraceae bacterium]